jgi:hypothetical protein
MTEPLIEQSDETFAEDFTDELADEALDRTKAFTCTGGNCGRGS